LPMEGFDLHFGQANVAAIFSGIIEMYSTYCGYRLSVRIEA
jgi:hypothetical protein